MSKPTKLTLDAEATCRCCLRSGGDIGVRSIFDVKSNFSVPPWEQLRTCADVHVRADDGLPRGICARCLTDLIKAHQFRSRCRKADDALAAMAPAPAPKIEFEPDPDRFMFDDQEVLSTAFESELVVGKAAVKHNNYAQKIRAIKSANETDIYESKLSLLGPLTMDKSRKTDPESNEGKRRRNYSQKISLLKSANESLNSDINSPDEPTESDSDGDETPREDPPKIVCLICKFDFVTVPGIKNHLQKTHKLPPEGDLDQYISITKFESPKKNERFLCHVCQEDFAAADELGKHMEDSHQLPPEIIVGNKYGNKFPNRRTTAKNVNYICTICKRMFLSLMGVNIHMKRRHPQIAEGTYHRHVKVKKVEDKMDEAAGQSIDQSDKELMASFVEDRVVCGTCKKDFSTFGLLKRHFKRAHNSTIELIQEYQCDQCPYVTNLSSKLNNHMFKHSDVKNFKCDECDKCFKFPRELLNHHKKQHQAKPAADVGKTYNCQICDMPFTSRWKLNEHKIVQHVEFATEENSIRLDDTAVTVENNESSQGFVYDCTTGEVNNLQTINMYKCGICQNSFSSKVGLKRHILKVHDFAGFIFEDRSKFKCDRCPYESTNKQSYNTHLFVHSETKDFKCETCQLEFKHETSMVAHIKRKHQGIPRYKGDKPFQCLMCRERFADKESLDEHKNNLEIHTPFPCLECHYITYKKQQLARHVRNHHSGPSSGKSPDPEKQTVRKQRAYGCPMCGKKFLHSSGLVKHQTVCNMFLF